MNIASQPIEDRPYEKFEAYGAKYLTDTELLAILLRSGTKQLNVVELAKKLMYAEGNHLSLLTLYNHSLETLMQIKGIGKVKAIQILSLLEISKRLATANYAKTEKITKPEDIANLYMEELRHKKEEHFFTIGLDVKNKISYSKLISKGNLTASLVHPREVYKFAITQSVYSIIILHNHPSGDPSPSKEDIEITKRLKKSGDLLGIPLLDHIVLGDRSFKSLKEMGVF